MLSARESKVKAGTAIPKQLCSTLKRDLVARTPGWVDDLVCSLESWAVKGGQYLVRRLCRLVYWSNRLVSWLGSGGQMEDPSLGLDHCCPAERMVAILIDRLLKCLR